MKPFLKKTQLYFFFILLLLSISTCKDKEKKPEDLGFLSLGEAKDYLLFKHGTWWVYKNSVTNELDSMVLTSCGMDTMHASSDKRYFDYENLGFSIKSFRDNATYSTYYPGKNADVIDFYIGWTWECSRNGGFFNKYYSGSGISCQFYYPFDPNRKRSNAVYETTFKERRDSMDVKGKMYYDVVSFSVTKDDSYPYPNINIGPFGYNIYYWAKNTGIIKIEIQGWDINDNAIYMNWELIKSQINK